MNTCQNKIVFSNAHHPEKKYCEWWYFSFFYNAGGVVSGIFKIENKTPEIWVFVKENGKEAQYLRKKFRFSSFLASKDVCDIKIGKNYFRETASGYEVKIDLGKIKFSASFKPNFILEDNVVAKELGKNTKAFWLVPCLKGSFSGNLEINGKSKYLSGTAFHDHVWYNINFLKYFPFFRKWLWGIDYSHNKVCLFVRIDFGQKIDFKFILCHDGQNNLKIVDGPDLKIEKNEALSEIDICYQGKLVDTIKITEKEPIFQWGDGRIAKFLTKKILGFSQHHCLGKGRAGAESSSYLEVFEK